MDAAALQKTAQALDLFGPAREKEHMNRTSVAIALVFAVVTFVIAATQPPGALTPPPDAFPLFAVLLALESIAFGIGVAYVVRNRETLFGAGTPGVQRAVAFAIAYLLLAPWPHESLHRMSLANGIADMNWFFLAGIEYAFHFGIVPIGLLFAAYAVRRGRAAA
jgi:hypothetical protein